MPGEGSRDVEFQFMTMRKIIEIVVMVGGNELSTTELLT